MKQWAQPTSYKNEAEQQAAGILIKLIVATGIAYLIGLLIEIYYYDVKLIVTLSVGITLLIVPYILLRLGQLSLASILLMLLVIGTLTASAMAGQGINDLIIIAFPIIYFFASMVLNRTAFRIFFALTLLAIFWLTFGELNGWFVPVPFGQTQWDDFVVVAVIFALAAFASDLLATSWRKNLERAEQEITERKQAELKLKESEDHFRSIFENATIGMYQTTPDGQIIIANTALIRMLGYPSLEALTNRNLNDEGFESKGERIEFLQRIESEGKIQGLESVWTKRNGEKIFVNESTSVICDKDGNTLFYEGTVEDITERKLAEEELVKSNSLRELLLDVITHDLRNPISTIFSFSELFRTDFPENELVKHIHLGSEHLLQVLDHTTTLAQATFGEDIPKEELSLNNMLTATVDEFSTRLTEENMDLRMEIPPDTMISANPLIAEVFKNYISNAIKYARDGKRIVIESVIEDQAVIVCVKDFGKTIAKADREQVFERRVQLEDGEKRGRGLGLAIVKRIALAHDGEVWVEANTPVGNSFCLRIPL